MHGRIVVSKPVVRGILIETMRLLWGVAPCYLSYCSTFKVFAGKVRKTGFFQKAGFPQNPLMSFVDYG